ncbi:hypothetical protein B484DRAFT_457724, partial [Ochromonadaceae sp. CCMP2298]
HHPDNKQAAEKDLANRQMMVINAAYKVLKSPELRAQYDMRRKMGTYGAKAAVKQQPARPTDAPPRTGVRPGTSSSSSSSSSAERNAARRAADRARVDAGGEDWFNYGRGTGSGGDEDVQTESLADILAELFGDISFNRGANIVNDLNDFLEGITGPGGVGGFGGDRDGGVSGFGGGVARAGGQRTRYDSFSQEQLASEVIVLQSALKHLTSRAVDLRNTLSVEEALLILKANGPGEKGTGSKGTSGAGAGTAGGTGTGGTGAGPQEAQAQRLAELEDRLRRQETVKSTKARLLETENQSKQLRRDVDLALAEQLRRRFDSEREERRSGYSNGGSVGSQGSSGSGGSSSGGSSSGGSGGSGGSDGSDGPRTSSSFSDTSRQARTTGPSRPSPPASSRRDSVEQELQKLKDQLKRK